MESRSRIALLVIAASVLVAACSGSDGEAEMNTLEGQWPIETVVDAEGHLVVPVEGTMPYLEFSGANVAIISGNTGCNSFKGPVQVGPSGTFAVGDLATTLMGCDDARATQEANIHRALGDADRWAVDSATAVLSANGVTVMEMSRGDTNLTGSRWSVTSINNGQGGVQSVAEGSDPTLLFGDGGRLSGSTGCNNLIATYTAGDGSLSFGQVGTTKKLCGTPAGIMEQEQQMVAALGRAESYSIAGEHLTIHDLNGATQIVGIRLN